MFFFSTKESVRSRAFARAGIIFPDSGGGGGVPSKSCLDWVDMDVLRSCKVRLTSPQLQLDGFVCLLNSEGRFFSIRWSGFESAVE